MSQTHDKALFGRINFLAWTAWICSAVAGWAVPYSHASTTPFSHYQSILDRSPFGPPPAPAPTIIEPTDTDLIEEEDPYIIPPGLDKIKVTLLSRFNGIPAAGFTDEASNTPYYLLEGQSFEEFNLVHVDLKKATVRLRRGAYETELPLWINPTTTNQADVATFGMPRDRLPQSLLKPPSLPRRERGRFPLMRRNASKN